MTLTQNPRFDNTEPRSHATGERICKKRGDKTPSRERERLRIWLRILDLSRPIPRVTHRHIPGVFKRFFQGKADLCSVAHPHVNRVSGCKTETDP